MMLILTRCRRTAYQADREQAWKDFAGWRVNYDRALIEGVKRIV